MKTYLYTIILLALLMISGQSLQAQQKINLKQAIEMAIENNPGIKAKQSQIKQAQAKNNQVKSSFLPQVNILSKYFYANNLPNFYPLLGKAIPVMDQSGPTGEQVILHPMAPYPDLSRDVLTMDLNTIYPIYTGHKRENALKLTEQLKKAYAKNIDDSKASLSYNVKQAYYNYLMLNAVINVYQEVLKQLNDHLKLAKEAYKEGIRSEFDVINFESKIEEFKAKIIDLKGKRAVVSAALSRLIGLPDGQKAEFEGDIKRFFKEENTHHLDINKLYNGNHKLAFLSEMQKVLDYKKEIQKAAKLPVVFAFGNYHIYHGKDFPPFDKTWRNGYAVGLGLKMNIFDGNKSKYQVDEIRAKQEELENYKDGLKLKLDIDYQKTREAINSLLAQKKAHQTHLKVAEKAYEIAQTAYKNGVITNIELNGAHLQVSKIKVQILKIEKDILTQKAYLKFLAGQIF